MGIYACDEQSKIQQSLREVCLSTVIWFEVQSEPLDCFLGRFDALFVNEDRVLAFIRSLLRCSPMHQVCFMCREA